MKITLKIALYSLCLLLSLTWISASVTYIIKTTSEKNIDDKKEALPENKSDEEKKFEIVYDFSPSFNIPFHAKNETVVPFCNINTIPQSVFLDLSNPPPEFHLFA